MIWLLSILAFVIIFSVLILIHEFGHFYVAKLCGIKVEEFGLGMPPRLWGWKPKKSETMYSLNAIPFGGFVRLYGEDFTDKKALRSKRSFVSKKPWQKLLVVSAGVFMNFLLSLLLLIFGFSVGMQPLLLTSDDVYSAIDSGIVTVAPGIVVKEKGENDIGFEPGDIIKSVNDKQIIFGDEIANLANEEKVKFLVERNGKTFELSGVNQKQKHFFEGYNLLPLSQIVVHKVNKDLANSDFRVGEVIHSIGGKNIYSISSLERVLSEKSVNTVKVPEASLNSANVAMSLGNKRASDTSSIGISKKGVVISVVLPGTAAESAGLLPGDEVLSINGVKLDNINSLPIALKTEILQGKAVYKILRDNSEIEFYLQKNADGTVGVLLSELVNFEKYGLTVYAKTVPYSVLIIKNVSYPFVDAVFESFREIGRLSVLTVHAFVDVFKGIFTKLSVPEGVSGPVGIAQMTFVFVQEGVMSLLRFAALLSLSLAIINILPFPGLDGGRFFLILIPALFGKKINPRLEAIIHVFGFLLLMLLLAFVTFNDLLKIFG